MVTNKQQACRQAVDLKSELNIDKGKLTARPTFAGFNYTFFYTKRKVVPFSIKILKNVYCGLKKILFLRVIYKQLIKFRQLNSYYGKERANLFNWLTPAQQAHGADVIVSFVQPYCFCATADYSKGQCIIVR